ncbi:MAG: phosphoenolpyruvate--protein phosphotransferase [Thermodesulfobacteriota bacterium]
MNNDDLPSSESIETVIRGIGGSPGICIGKAYLVDREGVDVIEKYFVGTHETQKEINRFRTAVTAAKNELTDIIAGIPQDLQDHAYILETHLLLHKDKMLYGKTIDIIQKDQVNAEWALKKATSSARLMFQNISDPYLQARSADIEHVSDRIMRHLIGADDVNISGIEKRVILVANSLSPAETSQIQLDRVMGFITDRGGKASHTSIIARTLEIPSVLGLEKATSRIRNDDLIIVDGNEGVVIINPEEETLLKYEELSRRFEAHKADIIRTGTQPATSADGRRFRIMGNIELPEEIVGVRDHGGDGIGLFRTEFLYLSRRDFPDENELYEQYKEVVELMAPNPVTIRTLDINGDKEISTMPTPQEANPALGLRAIRFCLKNPEIFKTQVRAILRSGAHGYVRLLLPMISGCEEVRQSLEIMDEAAEELEKEGLPYNRDIEVGIMIEVPSAAILAADMAKMVDFFSIGTNDLVQYTLAIDRGNRHVAHLYDPLHPAVIRLIRQVVDGGRTQNKPTYMCGEMAADPMHLPVLIGLGIDELSMAPQSIPEIKNMIRKISVGEMEKFMLKILKHTSAEATQKLIMDTYGDLLYEDVYG